MGADGSRTHVRVVVLTLRPRVRTPARRRSVTLLAGEGLAPRCHRVTVTNRATRRFVRARENPLGCGWVQPGVVVLVRFDQRRSGSLGGALVPRCAKQMVDVGHREAWYSPSAAATPQEFLTVVVSALSDSQPGFEFARGASMWVAPREARIRLLGPRARPAGTVSAGERAWPPFTSSHPGCCHEVHRTGG